MRYVVYVGELPWAAASTLVDAVGLALDGSAARGIGPVFAPELCEIELTDRRYPYRTTTRLPLDVAAERVGRPFREKSRNGDGSPYPLAGSVAPINGRRL